MADLNGESSGEGSLDEEMRQPVDVTLLSLFDARREALRRGLRAGACTPAQAATAVTGALDSLLPAYRQAHEDALSRDLAAGFLAVIKTAVAGLAAVGEGTVERRHASGGVAPPAAGVSFARMPFTQILVAAGLVFALLITLLTERAYASLVLALVLTGLAVLTARGDGTEAPHGGFPGRLWSWIGGGRRSAEPEETVEVIRVPPHLDADALLGSIAQTLRQADAAIAALGQRWRPAAADGGAETTGLAAEPMFQALAQDLLEAAAFGDGPLALKLARSKIPPLLARGGIETVMFDGRNRGLFEFMPSLEALPASPFTARPALVKDKALIRPGCVLEGPDAQR